MAADSGFKRSPARPRILVTRPLAVGESLAFEQDLEAAGFRVLSMPLIEVVTTAVSVSDWAQYDWVFFTSKNAVKSIGSQLSPASRLSIACVGPATEQALKPYGLHADFVSPVYDARNAVQYFADRYAVNGLRIFWPCGNLADPHLKTGLESQGASVTACPAYETRLKSRFSPQEAQALLDPHDLLVFTSPSAVEAFQQGLRQMDRPPEAQGAVACLGPRTAQAALKAFGRVDIQPEQYTLSALSTAIRQYFKAKEPL
ncbi:uroporphyrinogen-III synthase [Vampirovibrio chlorellavorus]|uniref:uroporphyrinogen-III synthase n=1 Tax=Vampirovibrio chlorellavorus TaxID=758823 RepID=UPI0026EFF357|nr:uroporphyrinogen-III synthase [Vampirovibrio chlorellavorus]